MNTDCGPRRRTRGQAAVEFALIAPVLLMLMFGTFDFGRNLADVSLVEAQVRVGLRVAQNDAPTVDAGTAIRNNAVGFLANTPATWGLAAAGGTDSCGVGSGSCGDPGGCVASSGFWTTAVPPGGAKPTACFAMTSCLLDNTTSPPSCLPVSPWGVRPVGIPVPIPPKNLPTALVLRVAVRFTAWTPMSSQFIGPNGLYVVRDGFALPLA